MGQFKMRVGRFALTAGMVAGLALSTTTAASGTPLGGTLAGLFSSARFAPVGIHLPFAGSDHAVCGAAVTGSAQCLVHILQPSGATPAARSGTRVSTPTGLPPATIQAVYGYPTTETGQGETIALVDAYNDPDAASDLAKFSAQYGLPKECAAGSSTSSGCFNFSQVNQTGGASLPATNASWDLEISLDIEWAHALAPAANIVLVEATTNSTTNLLAAETYASGNASYVSNSWGEAESSGEASDDFYFTHAGVSYFAASGDTGGEVEWPSASPDVTSVGGTSLAFTSGGALAQETAWTGGGGGCSSYENANTWQSTGSGVNCDGKRATPDLSLDADPNSGVSIYDTETYDNQSGWWTVGGTSAATVMVAAISADTGKPVNSATVYSPSNSGDIRDIIAGSNGYPAMTGYDLATGLGSLSNTPGAPTGLTAAQAGGGGGVALSWTPPTGPTPTGYDVWVGTASGRESSFATSIDSTTYTDPSATSTSATYYFEVQAVNGAGPGPFSNEASVAPPSAPPVASFKTSCSKATCSFTSTSTDAPGTIDAYDWNGGNNLTGSGSSFSDTYAAKGSYNVTLSVTNTAGQTSTLAASVTVTCSASTSLFGILSGKRLTCSG